MTTTANKKRAAKQAAPKSKPAAKAAKTAKSGKAAKPLRIREELLPDSATYITVADRRYVAIPVEDFGDWYEDALDLAVAEDREQDAGPCIPAEEVFAHLDKPPKAKK
ncbi:MAG: hypothetical protein LUC93_05605 [Planctomycetaceae bacterium]|nr:hypothetical protein [Planctomycetaceae bacterium]